MRFTLIDLIILIAVVFAIGSGYRRGFWLSLAQYAGLVVGVVIGATLAPLLMDALKISDSTVRSLLAVLILIVLGAIGSSAGYWVGEPIRLRLLAHPESGRIDSFGGAIFSALALLSVSWFLGLSLARVPSPPLASAIQRSSILRTLDSIFPRPPRLFGEGGDDHRGGQLSGRVFGAGAGRPIRPPAARLGRHPRDPVRSVGNVEDRGLRLRRHCLWERLPGRTRHGLDQRPRRGGHPWNDGAGP
jgi:uncharacterized membrane protein required for colicin V production